MLGTLEGRLTTLSLKNLELDKLSLRQFLYIDKSDINSQVGRVITPFLFVNFKNLSLSFLEVNTIVFSQLLLVEFSSSFKKI